MGPICHDIFAYSSRVDPRSDNNDKIPMKALWKVMKRSLVGTNRCLEYNVSRRQRAGSGKHVRSRLKALLHTISPSVFLCIAPSCDRGSVSAELALNCQYKHYFFQYLYLDFMHCRALKLGVKREGRSGGGGQSGL